MNEIRARVIAVIGDVTSSPAEEIARTKRFADLGSWDSLMHLNAVLALEKEFGVRFGIEEFVMIESVEKAVQLVQAQISE